MELKRKSSLQNPVYYQAVQLKQLCRHYAKGFCTLGKKCIFRHSVCKGESLSVPVVCRNFKNTGECQYGKKCKFVHRQTIEPPVALIPVHYSPQVVCQTQNSSDSVPLHPTVEYSPSLSEPEEREHFSEAQEQIERENCGICSNKLDILNGENCKKSLEEEKGMEEEGVANLNEEVETAESQKEMFDKEECYSQFEENEENESYVSEQNMFSPYYANQVFENTGAFAQIQPYGPPLPFYLFPQYWENYVQANFKPRSSSDACLYINYSQIQDSQIQYSQIHY